MTALTPQGMAWGAAALALALAAALALLAVARGWRGAGRLTAGARPDERRRAWRVAALGATLLLLALASGVMARRNQAAPVPAACRGVVASGRTNLLPQGTTPFAAFAGGTLATDGPADWVKPQAGSDLLEPRTRVQPGAHYCYSVETSGGGHGQVIAKWQDATLRDLPAPNSYSALPPQPVGAPLRGEFTAPAGAVYVQMLVRPSDGAPLFRNPTLAQAGLRVEPWPDGRAGALAFSFDWETAMGGLIHSKSQHDTQYAVSRGLAMRQGADILLGLFQATQIRGTFYATGYNLLDGNTERRTFAGDPHYKYGPDQGWQTTWWLTHAWYSDDPYGTVQSDPAWYFGDQTERLAAAGQEIGSHTFGHLYVRGTKPLSLTVDLDEWDRAAAARPTPLPPVRSFAFPWQSSNSIDARFYQVLADHGIDSVTRLYPPDLKDRYAIGAAPDYKTMLIMPDQLLGAAGQNESEGGAVDVAGGASARAVISQTVRWRGVTSFWQHPEQLTLPGVRAAWDEAISAAAAARDAGDLWVAPVTEITHRWRDTGQVDCSAQAAEGDHLTATCANHSPDTLAGVTITLPRAAQRVTIGGAVVAQARPEQVTLPTLAPNGALRLEITLAPEGGS
jgi:peptidoglycan/xylan/chitin deacetylase (PgdA/CDA1 family)